MPHFSLLFVVVLVATVAAVNLDNLERLVRLRDTGDLSQEQYDHFLAELMEAKPESQDTALAAILEDLGLPELLPTLNANGIRTEAQLLLLTHETMAKYIGTISLGSRLQLLEFVDAEKKQRQQQQQPKEAGTVDRAEMGALITDMILSHKEKRDDTRADMESISMLVAEAIEKNNEKLLDKVSRMIQAGAAPSADRHRDRHRALLQGNGAAPASRSLNTDGASMWLEDDDGKIILGVNGDTDLRRAQASVLATSGAFRVGDADDGACADDAKDAGTLRWSAADASLQVCDGEGTWKAAGGAVTDGSEAFLPAAGHCDGCDGADVFDLAGSGYCMAGGDDTAGDASLEACRARCEATDSCRYFSCKGDGSANVDCMLYGAGECAGAHGGAFEQAGTAYVTHARTAAGPRDVADEAYATTVAVEGTATGTVTVTASGWSRQRANAGPGFLCDGSARQPFCRTLFSDGSRLHLHSSLVRSLILA